MNKSELIDTITNRIGVEKKTVAGAVDALLDAVTRSVAKGERVVLTGFGSFEKRDRPARTGRNPATGATVKLKKTSVPRFKAGAAFKDVVSGAKKLPKVAAATKTATKAAATATGSTTRKSAMKRTTSAPAKRSAAKTTTRRTTKKT